MSEFSDARLATVFQAGRCIGFILLRGLSYEATDATARLASGSIRLNARRPQHCNNQPQDHESARPHRPADAARPRRRGDRMKAVSSLWNVWADCAS
jgi:hypothetical protein